MNFKLTRKEKIKLLQKIKEGKLSFKTLEPPQTYLFIERLDLPGYYDMNGKLFNEDEYQEFCKKIKEKNNNSIIWNEGKTYEDDIILFTYSRNCDQIPGEMQIPVKLSHL